MFSHTQIHLDCTAKALSLPYAMAGPSWLVDKSSIATKIKCASGETGRVISESDPTIACPNCQHVIGNSDVTQEWPGLPIGVKFDPSDQEMISLLQAKVGKGNIKPHPFIDEFIPTIDMEEGICYTHPRNLPGIALGGSASHFFHRETKAYDTGSRKRRRICGQDDSGGVRWHKTGKTKPVFLNGIHIASKQIMVLYTNPENHKAGKTNWIMHQYHLGTEETEKHGEYVASKIFYQQQHRVKLRGEDDQDDHQTAENVSPVTSSSATREPHSIKRQRLDMDQEQESHCTPEIPLHLSWLECLSFANQVDCDELANMELSTLVTPVNEGIDNFDLSQNLPDPQQFAEAFPMLNEGIDNFDLSQNLPDPQQFAEAFPMLNDLIQIQSPKRDGENGQHNEQHSLSAHLGPDQLKNNIENCQTFDLDIAKKNDIEECQNLDLDIAKKNDIEVFQNLDLDIAKKNDIEEYLNLDPDSPSTEFRLNQLDFSSLDSFIAWGGYNTIN